MLRFIPARAGNAFSGAMMHPRTVHPRACGERPEPGACRHAGERFIPARAGNACRVLRLSRPATGSSPRVRGTLAHSQRGMVRGSSPRVRGTRSLIAIRRAVASGSSPRVRGTLSPMTIVTLFHRFIPARAGNATITHATNTSPRFIPARAGNARPAARAHRTLTVHPRACGERLAHGGLRLQLRRFIPARAGNASPGTGAALVVGSSPRVRGTPRRLRRGSPSAVHPRACGERPPW